MQEKIKNEVWDAFCPKCGETDDINCGRLKYDFICNNCNHEWNLIDLTIQKTAQAIFEDLKLLLFDYDMTYGETTRRKITLEEFEELKKKYTGGD